MEIRRKTKVRPVGEGKTKTKTKTKESGNQTENRNRIVLFALFFSSQKSTQCSQKVEKVSDSKDKQKKKRIRNSGEWKKDITGKDPKTKGGNQPGINGSRAGPGPGSWPPKGVGKKHILPFCGSRAKGLDSRCHKAAD